MVSTWREDWVPLAKILCGGIPVSVITLMTLLFIGCCFMAHFDLVLRLGGSLRPNVLVLETLAAEFIFDVRSLSPGASNLHIFAQRRFHK